MGSALEYNLRDVSDRAYRLGGSSWGDLFEAYPWGCRRRLWYEIHGHPQDKEWRTPPSMMRGRDLEPIVLKKFMEERSLTSEDVLSFDDYCQQGGKFIDDIPDWMHPHPDAVMCVRGSVSPTAAIECKAVGAKSSRAMIADGGPPLGYKMQLHTYMFALGVRLGFVAVLDTWNWEFNSYPVDFDDDLWYNMISRADSDLPDLFFGELPELFWMDQRCKGCKFLGSCQAHERRKENNE